MNPMTLTRPGRSIVGAMMAVVALASAASAARDDEPRFPAEAVEFFESKIRPVLSEHCLSCHGAAKTSSGLRLDSRAAILEGGAIEGPAAFEGEPDGSPLVMAVAHEGGLEMPPDTTLPGSIVDDLRSWVAMGLPWTDDSTIPTPEATAGGAETHWSFQPVAEPEPPEVANDSWVATPVDAFVLHRLEAEGLRPSPPADRRTLIRRAAFDLVGLPPRPAEVEAFVDDPRPDDRAFAALVDRLLASPQYGERWGRHWLDVARYGDTKGYVFQEDRRYPYAYTYRDYVVRAFNDDTPFDRFLLEQLAADQLGLPEDDPRLAALGFLTVGQRFLNDKHDRIDDQIDVVGRGLMGLTISCARCHDHKFDPIPTADYYALYGVFDSSVEPESPPLIAVPSNADDTQRADFERAVAEHDAVADAFVAQKRDEILADYRDRFADFLRAASAVGFDPRNDAIDTESRNRGLSQKRLRNFIIRWSETTDRDAGPDDPILGPWRALADLPGETFAEGLASFVNDESRSVNPLIRDALRDPEPPRSFAEVIDRYAAVFAASGDSTRPEAAPIAALIDPADGIFAAIETDELIRLFERDEREAYRALLRKVDEIRASHPGAPPRAMVLVDADPPREPRIFIRGNPGNRGPEVPRRFLQLLEGEDRAPFSQGSGRLELARKIAAPGNPLTARVMVNRIWMHHFGRAIVGTPSDFGTRSDPPSHPDLLDDLARRFVDGGWSVKSLHRLILNSNTYRQASLNRPECAAVDPENALLWKQNRRRLELEPMRDAMLDVAGRLDPTIGGRPTVVPSDPEGTRRTLYSTIDRTFLDGVYRTFDFASTDATAAERPSTTVPQQALFLMNSDFAAAQARQLARRAEAPDGSADPAAWIDRLYRLLFGRAPDDREIEVGVAFLASRGGRNGDDLDGPRPASQTPGERYAHALLMTNEFLFID